jgi:hypothetical protein
MTPPIRLDEAGRSCPTYPCAICGRETPLYWLHGRLPGQPPNSACAPTLELEETPLPLNRRQPGEAVPQVAGDLEAAVLGTGHEDGAAVALDAGGLAAEPTGPVRRGWHLPVSRRAGLRQ